MNIKECLKELCSAHGVSGAEDKASETALRYLREFTDECSIDAFQNVSGVFRRAKEKEPTVLLDAHIDEIGLIITAIDEQGFLHVANCGGVDRRILLGQEVEILCEPPIRGIIATIPPHLSTGEAKVPEISDVIIDIGMNQVDAQQVVVPGDRVRIVSAFRSLLGTRMSAHALDDRACVAIILKALDLLKGKELHCGVHVLFSAQEETGERGAQISAYRHNPDMAIALDVSFAHTPDANEFACGKMGKGAMIGIAPSLDKTMYTRMIELAKEHDLPYQCEVMGGTTGTNADAISVSHGGVKTALLSLPLKYMHTPVEVVDVDDMEHIAQLLSCYLEDISVEKGE